MLRVVGEVRQRTELVLRDGWLTLLRLASERLSWPRFMEACGRRSGAMVVMG
mgnify:FL=1